jgi:hypothetical protein
MVVIEKWGPVYRHIITHNNVDHRHKASVLNKMGELNFQTHTLLRRLKVRRKEEEGSERSSSHAVFLVKIINMDRTKSCLIDLKITLQRL